MKLRLQSKKLKQKQIINDIQRKQKEVQRKRNERNEIESQTQLNKSERRKKKRKVSSKQENFLDESASVYITMINELLNSNQFKNYSDLDYKCLKPLIKKYFSPSSEINNIIVNIEKKYNLLYENICVLFYRGNDKNRETKKCGYNEYLNYANTLLKENSNLIFFIQSDETQFIEFIRKELPNKSFYFKDEIRHMKKCDSSIDIKLSYQNYVFSKKYLAITIIMSKCKYIICGSGNCDIWIMLYRGNNKNVIQNLNGNWYNNT